MRDADAKLSSVAGVSAAAGWQGQWRNCPRGDRSRVGVWAVGVCVEGCGMVVEGAAD